MAAATALLVQLLSETDVDQGDPGARSSAVGLASGSNVQLTHIWQTTVCRHLQNLCASSECTLEPQTSVKSTAHLLNGPKHAIYCCR